MAMVCLLKESRRLNLSATTREMIMSTARNKVVNLIAVIALGMLATACAPQGSNFTNMDYNSNNSTSGTYSDPSAITRMNYGY